MAQVMPFAGKEKDAFLVECVDCEDIFEYMFIALVDYFTLSNSEICKNIFLENIDNNFTLTVGSMCLCCYFPFDDFFVMDAIERAYSALLVKIKFPSCACTLNFSGNQIVVEEIYSKSLYN